MILGIGIDSVNIDRIRKILNRHGDIFVNRIYTEAEQNKANSRKDSVNTYAKHWAAKEACSKALGTGIRMGVNWKEMTISNKKSGEPTIFLSGSAKKRLNELTPEGHTSKIHISLSDDHPSANALVLIEANPLV